MDTRYGAQRRHANLPKKNNKGEVLFGPEPAPILPRQRGVIEINGERLTARQALERFPQLRGYLQHGRVLKERMLYRGDNYHSSIYSEKET